MASSTLNATLLTRSDTEANFQTNNPILAAGEMAISTDKNNRFKVGDGVNTWSDLSYNSISWNDVIGKPSAATTVPADVSTTAATGSSTDYARKDHVHAITVATGDSNGQVKIAGQNANVKGLQNGAFLNQFVGTTAEWDALTTDQKKAYDSAIFTDDYNEAAVGNLNTLTTTDKSSVVAAINEVNSAKQAKTDNSLTTTAKTVVGAINELKSGLTNIVKSATASVTTNVNGFLVLPGGKYVLSAYLAGYKSLIVTYSTNANLQAAKWYIDNFANGEIVALAPETEYEVTYFYI